MLDLFTEVRPSLYDKLQFFWEMERILVHANSTLGVQKVYFFCLGVVVMLFPAVSAISLQLSDCTEFCATFAGELFDFCSETWSGSVRRPRQFSKNFSPQRHPLSPRLQRASDERREFETSRLPKPQAPDHSHPFQITTHRKLKLRPRSHLLICSLSKMF